MIGIWLYDLLRGRGSCDASPRVKASAIVKPENAMSAREDPIELLELPRKAVSTLREGLTAVNVDVPAVVAQAVFVGVAGVLLVFFLWSVWHSKKALAKLGGGVGAVVAIAWVVTIVWTWIDYYREPLSTQLVSRIDGASIAAVTIELLDYKGTPMYATVDKDGSSPELLVSYTPNFADPPSGLRASAPGCKTLTQGLNRAQLRDGAEITLTLLCKE